MSYALHTRTPISDWPCSLCKSLSERLQHYIPHACVIGALSTVRHRSGRPTTAIIIIIKYTRINYCTIVFFFFFSLFKKKFFFLSFVTSSSPPRCPACQSQRFGPHARVIHNVISTRDLP